MYGIITSDNVSKYYRAVLLFHDANLGLPSKNDPREIIIPWPFSMLVSIR